jgi:hypothetical protein
MKPKYLWVAGVASLLAAACSKDTRTAPPLPPCTATGGGQVSQAYAAYTAIDPGLDSGCAVFQPNATGAEIDYLVVPQAASGVPNDSSSFRLNGGALPAPPLAASAVTAPLSPAEQFHLALRRAERELAPLAARARRPTAAAPAPAVTTINPGDRKVFKVCGDVFCQTHPSVVAFARKVGMHIAVFVDSAAEHAGDTLTTADLTALGAVFDTLLYPTDTAAFGRESDIDANGVVIVLMTGKVNSLVTSAQCTTSGFVAGYFYGGDLITGFSGGNSGEVFYSMVPDPTGALSCMHSATGVKHTVPGTFIHEFQHMISFNQHVLLRGSLTGEILWLNEGLSHYAEEMGARLFTPGDSTTFCYFLFGDLYNSNQYLSSPQKYFLADTSGIGGLANRGAYWLFVRFIVGRYSADTSLASEHVFTRSLETTTATGKDNVANATHLAFETVVEHWALANYVSDLPGFTPPSELQYVKWHFRSDYPTLASRCGVFTGSSSFPSAYPLVAASGAGSTTTLSGTLRGGSGTYYVAQQAAGASKFSLLFTDGAGAALQPSLLPRLNIIRIQ